MNGSNISPRDEQARASLRKFRDDLLKIPGCTGVAIGEKQIHGENTGQIAIVAFVKEKLRRIPDENRIPSFLSGVVTDVVQREDFSFGRISTDPFDRFADMFSGISITPEVDAIKYGTIGLFVEVEAVTYLLTCQHVFSAANPGSAIIQPAIPGGGPIPGDYVCGQYVLGLMDTSHDCAISTVGDGRNWSNKVPNYPWRPGYRNIRGVGRASVGDDVYKYGANSKFTEGVVKYTDLSSPLLGIEDAIEIDNDDNDVWVAKGDSGSVAIRKSDDVAVALNFGVLLSSEFYPPPPVGYRVGYGYHLQSQIDAISRLIGAPLRLCLGEVPAESD
jgi:hypothetical protein